MITTLAIPYKSCTSANKLRMYNIIYNSHVVTVLCLSMSSTLIDELVRVMYKLVINELLSTGKQLSINNWLQCTSSGHLDRRCRLPMCNAHHATPGTDHAVARQAKATSVRAHAFDSQISVRSAPSGWYVCICT